MCFRLLLRRVVVVADIVMLKCDLLSCFPCLPWLYLPIPCIVQVVWMGKCVQLGVDTTFETQTQGHVKNTCCCFSCNWLWKCKRMKGFCWLANGCMCILSHAISMKTPGNELRIWGLREGKWAASAEGSQVEQQTAICYSLWGTAGR